MEVTRPHVTLLFLTSLTVQHLECVITLLSHICSCVQLFAFWHQHSLFNDDFKIDFVLLISSYRAWYYTVQYCVSYTCIILCIVYFMAHFYLLYLAIFLMSIWSLIFSYSWLPAYVTSMPGVSEYIPKYYVVAQCLGIRLLKQWFPNKLESCQESPSRRRNLKPTEQPEKELTSWRKVYNLADDAELIQ